MCRFYDDYDDDDDDDDDDAGGDVISIHDDDSEPETNAEPAAKLSRLSDDVAVTTAAMTTAAEAASAKEEVVMMEYWQANSYNVSLAADDTDDAHVMFAKCPQLMDASCSVVDLKPGEMLYLPASWLFEVLHATHALSHGFMCSYYMQSAAIPAEGANIIAQLF